MNNSCGGKEKSFYFEFVQHRYQFCVRAKFLFFRHSTVCSFNEKANSKKLFAWLTFSSASRLFLMRKISEKKELLQRAKSIIQFASVWWFMDESCTICQYRGDRLQHWRDEYRNQMESWTKLRLRNFYANIQPGINEFVFAIVEIQLSDVQKHLPSVNSVDWNLQLLQNKSCL